LIPPEIGAKTARRFPGFNDETAHVVAVSSNPSCQRLSVRQGLVAISGRRLIAKSECSEKVPNWSRSRPDVL
jgi:hypothetical protein